MPLPWSPVTFTSASGLGTQPWTVRPAMVTSAAVTRIASRVPRRGGPVWARRPGGGGREWPPGAAATGAAAGGRAGRRGVAPPPGALVPVGRGGPTVTGGYGRVGTNFFDRAGPATTAWPT